MEQISNECDQAIHRNANDGFPLLVIVAYLIFFQVCFKVLGSCQGREELWGQDPGDDRNQESL